MAGRADDFPKTTIHIRNALGGNVESLTWVVERLSPLLLAHADYRLGPSLRIQVDPHDLVNEAWMVTLPRMSQLVARDGRITPVLLKFLTTCITRRIGQRLRNRFRDRVSRLPAEQLEEIPADISNVDARMQRSEMHSRVLELLAVLGARDREIIILRGIEQHSSQTVSQMLDISPSAVDQRYSRSLRRLRCALPESVFDEFLDE